MIPTNPLAGILMVATLSACSSQPSPSNPLVLYDKKEAVQLSYCAELADNTYYVAVEKLRGVPKQQLIARFARGPSAKILTNLIDDAYRTDIDSSWDYAVTLFNQCAVKVANVPQPRLDFARLCAQKSLVAAGAYEDKFRGKPKVEAYTTYASYPSLKPYEVIDWVYASDDTHTALSKLTWKRCMDVVSE